jgi:hypothetical protein
MTAQDSQSCAPRNEPGNIRAFRGSVPRLCPGLESGHDLAKPNPPANPRQVEKRTTVEPLPEVHCEDDRNGKRHDTNHALQPWLRRVWRAAGSSSVGKYHRARRKSDKEPPHDEEHIEGDRSHARHLLAQAAYESVDRSAISIPKKTLVQRMTTYYNGSSDTPSLGLPNRRRLARRAPSGSRPGRDLALGAGSARDSEMAGGPKCPSEDGSPTCINTPASLTR